MGSCLQLSHYLTAGYNCSQPHSSTGCTKCISWDFCTATLFNVTSSTRRKHQQECTCPFVVVVSMAKSLVILREPSVICELLTLATNFLFSLLTIDFVKSFFPCKDKVHYFININYYYIIWKYVNKKLWNSFW